MKVPIAQDHMVLLVLLASLLSAFLSLLWRERRAEQLRLFARLFVALVGGAVALGWLMRAIGPP